MKESVKQLYTNMMIVPAFSGSDRLTKRNIDALALEHIITVVCNACSALCGEAQERFELAQRMIGEEHPFCYLCMPSKCSQDNAADYYVAQYTAACMECEKYCPGYIWEVSFSECTKSKGCYSAKVIGLNF